MTQPQQKKQKIPVKQTSTKCLAFWATLKSLAPGLGKKVVRCWNRPLAETPSM